MDKNDKIIAAIYRAVDDINDELENGKKIQKSLDTYLYGRDSKLDSLNLVSLIVKIEEETETEFNQTILLVNEKAMSLNNSPFRMISSLVEYISSLLDERSS